MKRTRVIATVLLVVVTMLAVPLTAAWQGASKVKHRAGLAGALFMRGLAAEIDLTDEQVIELRHIAKAVRTETTEARGMMRSNGRDAALTLLENPGNIEGALAILEQNDLVKDEIRSSVLRGISQGLSVLTPEQRSTLRERVESMEGMEARADLF